MKEINMTNEQRIEKGIELWNEFINFLSENSIAPFKFCEGVLSNYSTQKSCQKCFFDCDENKCPFKLLENNLLRFLHIKYPTKLKIMVWNEPGGQLYEVEIKDYTVKICDVEIVKSTLISYLRTSLNFTKSDRIYYKDFYITNQTAMELLDYLDPKGTE